MIPIRRRGRADEPAPAVNPTPQAPTRLRVGDLALNSAAVASAFRTGPFQVVEIPQSEAISRPEQDAQEARCHEILVRCAQGVGSDYKEVDATMAQDPELDGLQLLAMKPLDLANAQQDLHAIPEMGLENTVGSRFPVQNMEDFVMAAAGIGPPEAKPVFEAACGVIVRTYRPRKMLKWFHEDVSLPSDFPGYILPMIDYTEAAFEAANPGVQETTEYQAYLAAGRAA